VSKVSKLTASQGLAATVNAENCHATHEHGDYCCKHSDTIKKVDAWLPEVGGKIN
jgi:hypothetical protein